MQKGKKDKKKYFATTSIANVSDCIIVFQSKQTLPINKYFYNARCRNGDRSRYTVDWIINSFV